MNELTVALMCHNRPKTAVEAIKSIQDQTLNNFDFIVSDNSTNNELQNILIKDFPKIESVIWDPHHKTLFDHFNALTALVKTKYLVLFHDDDVMSFNYVKRILEEFSRNPNASAIATNGYFINADNKKINNKVIYDGSIFKSSKKMLSFNDKNSILVRYLAWDSGGVAPFDSYAYNLSKIKDLKLDFSRGRHYCDTVFVLDVVMKGEIVWINEPLIKVRLHKDQVSEVCDVRDYKSFISTMLKESKGDIDQFSIDEYRFRNLLYSLRKRGRFPFPAIKFFLGMIPKLFFRSRSFRKRILASFLRR